NDRRIFLRKGSVQIISAIHRYSAEALSFWRERVALRYLPSNQSHYARTYYRHFSTLAWTPFGPRAYFRPNAPQYARVFQHRLECAHWSHGHTRNRHILLGRRAVPL